MIERKKIKTILELFIAWNGETEVIDTANLDSAVDFIIDSLQEEPVSKEIGNYNHTAVLEGLGYQSKEEPVSEDLEKSISRL